MRARYFTMLFFSTILALFIVFRAYSSLILTITYAAILAVGCLAIWVVDWLEKSQSPGQPKRLIYCPLCEGCLPLIPENKAPEYVCDKEIQKDDYENFIRRHRSKALIHLSILMGPWRKGGRSKNIYNPIKDELFLAKSEEKNRERLFLVWSGRSDIHEPLQYEAFPLISRRAISYCLAWIFP